MRLSRNLQPGRQIELGQEGEGERERVREIECCERQTEGAKGRERGTNLKDDRGAPVREPDRRSASYCPRRRRTPSPSPSWLLFDLGKKEFGLLFFLCLVRPSCCTKNSLFVFYFIFFSYFTI